MSAGFSGWTLRRRRLRSTPIVAIALGVLAGVTLTGCGGGFLGQGDGNPTGGVNNPAPNPFAGTYKGTVTLDNAKPGVLVVTVGTDGKATGTLSVTGPAQLQSRVVSFAAGVYNITGTVNATTGGFTVNIPNIPGAGAIVITGTLPSATAAGSFNVTAQGQSFPGVLPIVGSGNPGGGNPGGGGVPLQTISSGSAGYVISNPSADLNIDTSAPKALASIFGVVVANGAITSQITNAVFGGFGKGNSGNFEVAVNYFDGSKPAAGDILDIFAPNATSVPPRNAGVKFNFQNYGTPDNKTFSYDAIGGKVVVESVQGGAITVRVENAAMVARTTPVTVLPGKGSFTLNAKIVKK